LCRFYHGRVKGIMDGINLIGIKIVF
jgi:ribosomal protein L18